MKGERINQPLNISLDMVSSSSADVTMVVV